MPDKAPDYNGCALPSRDHKKPAQVATVDLPEVIEQLHALGFTKYIIESIGGWDVVNVSLVGTGGRYDLTEVEYQKMISDGDVT